MAKKEMLESLINLKWVSDIKWDFFPPPRHYQGSNILLPHLCVLIEDSSPLFATAPECVLLSSPVQATADAALFSSSKCKKVLVFNSNHENIKTLFTGRDIFRAVMSEKRFATLLSALRFDNPEDRAERKKEDPVAAISYIFNAFIENSQSVYGVGQSTTVDEMLLQNSFKKIWKGVYKIPVYHESYDFLYPAFLEGQPKMYHRKLKI
ncbi:hypothetical protein NQ318_011851 [Aromia moschata]|uniref:PiggyBac transposable element-derived protein domain-containing protein n=1 Tax=Aromia moschata TaxID=1265417 RepID=A0AAV8X1I3_9CUCU|nr:hypothetical protein NQ318_011851 [Aromia moschata]